MVEFTHDGNGGRITKTVGNATAGL